YEIVRQVPYGRVTSYGHIAKLMGKPRNSRLVGQALKFLSADSGVPWQRIISSSGTIVISSTGAQRQRAALEAEGVEVTVGRTGNLHVSMRDYGWFPDSLEADDADAGEEEEE
ncbi:6-O-methylguanine DNA methyltransferase, partial [Auriculariales sp. MPI-PUGE-AT-0066]